MGINEPNAFSGRPASPAAPRGIKRESVGRFSIRRSNSYDVPRLDYTRATFVRTAMIARKVAAHSPECERLVTSRGLS